MTTGSLRARNDLLADVESTLDEASTARLGSELFGVVEVLDTNPGLRRALIEPAVAPEAKRQLVEALFSGQVGKPALKVLNAGVAKRWRRTRDLVDALEEVAIVATAASAEEAGKLDDVEDELFRFGRIVDATPELREALSDGAVSLEGKRALLADVLGRKVSKTTRDLLDQIVVGRHGTMARGTTHYQHVLATRHELLLATAWVASEITDAHKKQITGALTKTYGRPVHLNVVIDPDVIGGVRVLVGPELIDSTMESRLADAQRQMAG